MNKHVKTYIFCLANNLTWMFPKDDVLPPKIRTNYQIWFKVLSDKTVEMLQAHQQFD